jgi:hypothetical protein
VLQKKLRGEDKEKTPINTPMDAPAMMLMVRQGNFFWAENHLAQDAISIVDP